MLSVLNGAPGLALAIMYGTGMLGTSLPTTMQQACSWPANSTDLSEHLFEA